MAWFLSHNFVMKADLRITSEIDPQRQKLDRTVAVSWRKLHHLVCIVDFSAPSCHNLLTELFNPLHIRTYCAIGQKCVCSCWKRTDAAFCINYLFKRQNRHYARRNLSDKNCGVLTETDLCTKNVSNGSQIFFPHCRLQGEETQYSKVYRSGGWGGGGCSRAWHGVSEGLKACSKEPRDLVSSGRPYWVL